MKQRNKKSPEARLNILSRLYRDGEITDKNYDVLDSVYRVAAGWLTVEDIEEAFLPEKNTRKK